MSQLEGFVDDPVGPTERREFLGIMADQAEELHALIEDLITFSRLEAGSVALEPEDVDLHELTARVLADLGARADAVSNQVAPGTMMFADPLRLRQILRNLVDNAIKYGDPPVTVAAAAEDGWIRCSVLDSGSGIAREQLEGVFEPYSRLVDDRTMSAPGLGLGLPIARGLVAAHGGDIRSMSSGPLWGLEFTVPSTHRATSRRVDLLASQ